jgi:quercetin dioxygenase-like cupin family protein
LRGAFVISLAGETHEVRAGQTTVVPAGVERRVHAKQAGRSLLASRAAPNVTTARRGSRRRPWAE